MFSSLFLSVLTRRDGYNLGDPAEVEIRLRWNPGGVDQRSPLLGSEAAEMAALRSLGELVEEQQLLQELHLAVDQA